MSSGILEKGFTLGYLVSSLIIVTHCRLGELQLLTSQYHSSQVNSSLNNGKQKTTSFSLIKSHMKAELKFEYYKLSSISGFQE